MNWIYIVENPINQQTASLTHVLEFCHAVSKIDRVTLISQAEPNSLPDIVDYQCLQIKPIRIRPHNLGYLLSTIKAYFYLQEISRSYKPDIIYERAVGFSLGPLMFARLRNISSVLEINGNWEDEHRLAVEQLSFPKKQLVSFINAFRGYSMILACHLAQQVIVVTPNLAVFLHAKGIRGENKIHIVGNGVNIERFKPLDEIKCKLDLGLHPDINYIGFVGNLALWQGVDDLISAYARLPQELKRKYYLLIIGSGPEYQRYMQISQELNLGNSVIFAGAKPYTSIPLYLGACSVLAAPKRPLLSGFSPIKIFEYLACARPILASAVEGLEFIESEKLGILFTPGDVNDLTIKLQTILNLTEEEKKEVGEIGRQYVVANHSWDAIVRTIRQYVN